MNNTATIIIVGACAVVAVAIVVKALQPPPAPKTPQSETAQTLQAAGSLLESLSHFSY